MLRFCYFSMNTSRAIHAQIGPSADGVYALPGSGRPGGSNVNRRGHSARKPVSEAPKKTTSPLANIEVGDAGFMAFFERAPFVMFIYDPKSLKISKANAAAVTELGYSYDEFRGLPLSSLVEPEDRVEFVRCLRTQPIASPVSRWRLRTRADARIEVELRTIRARRRGRRADIAVLGDISAQKRAEEKLNDSRRRYIDLFRASPTPMWVYESDTLAFLAVNDAAVEHYGYSRREFLSMTLRDIRPPDTSERLSREARREKHEVVRHGEWKHRKRDGTMINVQVATGPIDWEGRRARLAVITDVTRDKTRDRSARGCGAHRAPRQLGVRLSVGYADMVGRNV